ncbi:hypothetical protein RM555_09685 [Micromonospora sp. DSM 115977]|uniref:Immunity protein Imm1 n=1 Tax=Micromonospora reichwaldensis TaxID=3075516 RepID=A0ABU2WTK2_9ACTN|nr:hypothetical protein [Micromonospora sp. DSM 115977]MDT0529260.1 hypothetical protein [Micromonospora sp. DSM 115977]
MRIKLYVDVAEYAERGEAFLEKATDDIGFLARRDPSDPMHTERLGAQLRLLAPEAVHEPWAAFLKAEDMIIWELHEGSPNLGLQGRPYLDAEDPLITNAVAALNELRKQLKIALQDPDKT